MRKRFLRRFNIPLRLRLAFRNPLETRLESKVGVKECLTQVVRAGQLVGAEVRHIDVAVGVIVVGAARR